MVVSPTIFIFSLQTLKEFLMIKTRLLRSSKTWVTLKAFGHPGSPVFPPWVSWQQQEKQGKTTAKSWLTVNVCELNVRITWSKLAQSNSRILCRLQRLQLTIFVFNGCFNLFYLYMVRWCKRWCRETTRGMCIFYILEAAFFFGAQQGWSKLKQQNHDVILIWWIQWRMLATKIRPKPFRSRWFGIKVLRSTKPAIALRNNNPWTGKSMYTPITNSDNGNTTIWRCIF